MRRRLHQFFSASRLPGPEQFDLAAAHLPLALVELFKEQHPRDIVHGWATAHWLIARGHDEPDLIGAALLHDIGKGLQRRLDRTTFVLAGGTGLVGLLADRESRFELRRALARSLHHSGLGARLLTEAAAPERVVQLTLRHHLSADGDAMLALLQQADAAS